MRSQFLWSVFFISLLLTTSTIASFNDPTSELIIQKDKIFDPHTLSFDSVKVYEKDFNFDSHNYSVTSENQNKINEVEAFIQKHNRDEYQQLNHADQQALGKIFYKLGLFYLRVLRQPDTAIAKFNLALGLIKNQNDRTWATNYLAYAYEQKYAEFDDDADKDKALSYANKIISQNGKAKNREVAFAYYVKGLTQTAAGKYTDAENSLVEAAKIYNNLPEKGDQYSIINTSLAEIILIRDGRDGEALNLLQQAEQYWRTRHIVANPYAAKTILALAEVDLRLGNTKIALEEYKKGITILQRLYGNNSKWLIEPYQHLSEAYKKLGDQKLALVYENKADALNKG